MTSTKEIIQKVKKSIAVLWLFLFIFGDAALAMSKTMLPVSVYFVLFLSIACSVLLLSSVLGVVLDYLADRGKKQLYVLIFRLLVLFTVYWVLNISNVNANTTIWLMILFAVTANCWNEDRLLKTGLVIGTAVVVLAFFLAMTGVIENNRGDSFGFIYRTHYACFLLCMTLTFAIIRDGRFSWKEELGLIALWGINQLFIGGKTFAVCLFLLILGSLWYHYHSLGHTPYQEPAEYPQPVRAVFKLLYFPFALLERVKLKRTTRDKWKQALIFLMKYSFILFGAFYIILTASYRQLLPLLNHIPGLGTVKSRLIMGCIAFEEYPLSLWGNSIPQAGHSASEKSVSLYYALDSGYVKIPQMYGLVIFLLIIGLLTFAQIRLCRKKRYYSMFALTLFAIDSMMEYWMYDLSYNLFILLSFCVLKEPVPLPAHKSSAARVGKGSRARGIVLAVLAGCFAVWCFSAYQITAWRGWTPEYGATLVVPGDYIDSDHSPAVTEQRLKWAGNYLNSHPDAMCIVASPEAKKTLTDRGIDQERILLDADSASIEDMLLRADALIGEHNLPNRLTVCTYAMQQPRIDGAAKELHIPVNSLTMNMPKGHYLKNFTAEQWKLLWKK